MKAIQTRYLGCTNHRPARIKTWAEGLPPQIVSIHSLEGYGLDEQFKAAAYRFCGFYDWTGRLISGTLPNGDGCHVFAGDDVGS